MIVYPYIVSGRELAEHLPLQQGLRPFRSHPSPNLVLLLAEHLPLQQGLRLSWSFTSDTTQGSRRASSITTRIKTRILDLLAS